MRKNSKGFVGAVAAAALTVGLMLLLTWAMLADYFGGGAEPLVTGLILFCAFLYLAIAVGVVAALWQRWKEIQGGEEDEARKY